MISLRDYQDRICRCCGYRWPSRAGYATPCPYCALSDRGQPDEKIARRRAKWLAHHPEARETVEARLAQSAKMEGGK